MFSTKYSTSSLELLSPNVTLNADLDISLSNPIAVNTCDGTASPELHAEPAEQHIHFLSSSRSKAVESTPKKEILELPGNLLSILPFILTLFILFNTSK